MRHIMTHKEKEMISKMPGATEEYRINTEVVIAGGNVEGENGFDQQFVDPS